uniref:C2H2-type domain-containing protein n=1 Tax=Cacopsylla melanoneura TaxID=428564 RepID=A0A8D8SM93_9HEMI
MLHIKWQDRIANEEVLRRANSMDIEDIIKIRRLRWAGHLSRMPTDRLPQQMALGELDKGKRMQCKPKKRWADTIKDDLKSLNINTREWRELAADRTAWREETKSRIMRKHEENLEQRTERRLQRHEEEDTYSWKCPLCDFLRIGRRGRQYVNSHISQAHRTRQDTIPPATRTTDIHCLTCNQQCKSKAGLISHMRHKHPDVELESNSLRPIRLERSVPLSNTHSDTQHDQPTRVMSNPSSQWSCPHCHREFRSKAGLSSHTRSNKCGVQS